LWWLEENKRRDGARVRFSVASFFLKKQIVAIY
jgi:hypothetical protein